MGNIHEAKSRKGFIRFKKLRAIFKSLKKGASILEACRAADIHYTNFWHWRQENERLELVVRAIIDSRIQMVEDALFSSAVKGNTTSMIFFLTNRSPERWSDRRALVQNNIFNNGKNNANGQGSFTGEDKALQERIRADFLAAVP